MSPSVHLPTISNSNSILQNESTCVSIKMTEDFNRKNVMESRFL